MIRSGSPPVEASTDITSHPAFCACSSTAFSVAVLPDPRVPSRIDVYRSSRGPFSSPARRSRRRSDRPTISDGGTPNPGTKGLGVGLGSVMALVWQGTPFATRFVAQAHYLLHKRTTCCTNAQSVALTTGSGSRTPKKAANRFPESEPDHDRA